MIHFPIHVYYGARNNCTGAPCNPAIPAWLDVDDTTSFGPETITIFAGANGSFEPGTYRYSVHHYSGLDNIPASGATVQLYQGQTLPGETLPTPVPFNSI